MTELPRYDPGLEEGREGMLCLHRNENLFVGPEWTEEAARALLTGSVVASYPDPEARALREAIGALYGVSRDEVFVGNGADEVLAALLLLLRRRYAEVHVLDVSFKVYPLLAARYDYRLSVLPGDTFRTGEVQVPPDFKGLALVDSPNAITGRSVAPQVLEALASSPEAFLIWDNVYGEYAGEEPPRPLPPNVAVVRSFSKYYGLAGLRVGYCLAPAPVVAELLGIKDIFNVNGFAQVMALEALRRRNYFEGLAVEMRAAREALRAELGALGFEVKPGVGHFLLVRHPERSGAELEGALRARGIAVRRFAEPPTADWIRITVPPRAACERLLDALAEILGCTRREVGP